LTPDTLTCFADAVRSHPQAAIFYSDEDLLIDGKPAHPFYRPDYDPVHIRAHSFIWHAILFNRRLAVELGVYTSKATQFALDWDTLIRFDTAGYRPVHVGEVLYHWRQHRKSLSNSGRMFEGTLSSIKGALELVRQGSGQSESLSVERYPVDTGTPDYYLKRLPCSPPSVGLVTLTDGSSADVVPDTPFPFDSSRLLAGSAGRDGIRRLLELAKETSQAFFCLCGPSVTIESDAGLWQAIKHFELVPEVMAVGGPLCNIAGRVLFGAPVRLDGVTLFDPLVNLSVVAPAKYLLSTSKPHCVSALSADFLLVRRTDLIAALEAAPPGLGFRSLGMWLGLFAEKRGQVLAFEPLMRGFARKEGALLGDPIEGLQTALSALANSGSPPGFVQRGVAGFEKHARLHPR
jgi:hypothetical protein